MYVVRFEAALQGIREIKRSKGRPEIGVFRVFVVKVRGFDGLFFVVYGGRQDAFRC